METRREEGREREWRETEIETENRRNKEWGCEKGKAGMIALMKDR